MERRIAGWTSLFTQPHRAPVLILAAVLIVVGAPGAAQGMARPVAPGLAVDVSPAPSADPIGELAHDLAYDPQRIFRFVSDEIRYEPYPGILRGPRGTLEAQAGNSVDKSLLLAALLKKSLVSYRFARGALDETTSSTLVDSLATDLSGARQSATDPLVQGLDEVRSAGAALRPTDSARLAEVQQDAHAAETDTAKRLEDTTARLDDTVSMIQDELQGAGIDLPSGTAVALPPAETTAHTWVQMADGATWVDLDPTLSGATPGTALTSATETRRDLPDDLRYTIEFGVQVETVSGGQLATREILTHDGYADELSDTPVTFAQGKPSGFKALGVSLGNLLGDGWIQYRPALFIADQAYVANDSVGFPSGDGSNPLGSQASGAPAGPVEGEATAEWLEVRVTSPGSEPQIYRRTVFDRLPAEERAAGNLALSAVEPAKLVEDGKGSSDFLPMLGVRTFAIATGTTSPSSVAAVSRDSLGMSALSYHTVRDALAAEIALADGARTFLNGPNIAALTVDVELDDGKAVARSGLDIWRRQQGILPLEGSPVGTAQAQLIAGVLDQVAEHFVIDTNADPKAPIAVSDIGAVFEAAAGQGIPTRVLHGSVPATLPYGSVASRLIRDAVLSGDVVIVPAEPVKLAGRERVGWWRVDPQTGITTDVMDDGAGQSMGEYVVIVDEDLGTLICHGLYARRVAFLIYVAALAVGAYGYTDIFWRYEDGYQGLQCSAG